MVSNANNKIKLAIVIICGIHPVFLMFSPSNLHGFLGYPKLFYFIFIFIHETLAHDG